MKYKIVFKRSVAKDIRKIPKKDVQKVIGKITLLSANPRPKDSEKLTANEKYRIRQGNYRILYSIEDSIITITVVKIGHRKEVYQQ